MIAGLLALAAYGSVALLPCLPEVEWLAGIALLLGCGLLLLPGKKAWLYLLLLVIFCWRGVYWGQAQLDNRLIPELEGIDLLVEGFVVGLPHNEERYQRFDFQVARAFSAAGERLETFPGRLRLTSYRAAQLRGGEGRRLRVRLKQPRGFANPAAFDYELWLLNRSIGAVGYVRYIGESLAARSAAARLATWREAVRQEFTQQVHDRRVLGVALALALGDKSAIDAGPADTILRAGLSHLLAISGLHVGLVGGFGFALGRLAGGVLSLWAPLWAFGPRWGVFGACLSAASYAALSGFGIPAQRALIMLLVWSAWYLWRRRGGAWHGWWFSLLAVLWLQPLALLEVGFWFSFAAVAMLIFLSSRHWRRPGARLRQLVFAQVGLFAALSLLQVYWGMGVSVHAAWINLIAIPFVSFAMVPLLLLALLAALVNLPFGTGLLLLAQFPIRWFWRGLDYLDSEVGLVYWQPDFVPGLLPLCVALLAVVLILVPLRLPLRLLGLLTAMLAIPGGGQGVVGTRITLLDVGQGLAVVGESEGRTLLYDTGPRFSRRFNAGEAAVLPYLRGRGIKAIDLLVVSHNDSDHSGGYESVNRRLQARQTLWGESAAADEAARELCTHDRQWRLGQIQVYLLGSGLVPRHWNANNRSCVLLLDIDGYRILLPGDIEREREAKILQHPLLASPVDVIVAPHHGSKTSSSAALIAQLQPAVAIFSAGYRSRYGHPHPGVIERYRRAGTSLYCTSASGAMLLDFTTGAAPHLLGWRQTERRYWRFDSAPECQPETKP